MYRYALVILTLLSCLSVAYRHRHSEATLRLEVGAPNEATLKLLKSKGATFQPDDHGFRLKLDQAGVDCLFALRRDHLAAREACLAALVDKTPEVASHAQQARLHRSFAELYDRGLRRAEENDRNLLVLRLHLPLDERVDLLDDYYLSPEQMLAPKR